MTHLLKLSHEDIGPEANLKDYGAYDQDGEKLGDVDEVIADADSMDPRYLVIDGGGWFSSKQFVVPIGEVKQIDDGERRVYFKTLTKQTLRGGSYPRYDERWWDTNDHERFSKHERDVAGAYQQNGRRVDTVDYAGELYRRPEQGAQQLQLLEERLKVNKARYQAGSVKVGKRITQRTETAQVPVREEWIFIERVPALGTVTVENQELSEGETIDLPVMTERINVGKDAVVTEEVDVRKEVNEHTEQVQETLRKEELEVHDSGGLVTEHPRASGALIR